MGHSQSNKPHWLVLQARPPLGARAMQHNCEQGMCRGGGR